MKFYSIGEFAKRIGKTPQTVRNWDEKDILKPHHVSESGYRYYSQEQLNGFLGIVPKHKRAKRRVVGYCRVNTKKEKEALQRQIEGVKAYMIQRGYQFDIVADIGIGANLKKMGIKSLIESVLASEIERIVVLDKYRLGTIGYELIEIVCNAHDTTIEIIDNTVKSYDEELVNDLFMYVNESNTKISKKKLTKFRNSLKELL